MGRQPCVGTWMLRVLDFEIVVSLIANGLSHNAMYLSAQMHQVLFNRAESSMLRGTDPKAHSCISRPGYGCHRAQQYLGL